jgi:hypothetical protein
MGFLPFKKKKNKATAAAAIQNNNTAAVQKNASAAAAVTVEKKKWSPMRKRLTTPATAKSPTTTPSFLGSLTVMATDDVEVATFESQRALMDQREAIRKKLFASSNAQDEEDDSDGDDDGMRRSIVDHLRKKGSTASEASKEVLANGKVNDAHLTSDRFSVPLSSLSGSWDGSLRKITEEPVEYSSPRARTAPISVDVSYTESELGSVRTKPLTPPVHGNKSKPLDPPSQTRRSANSTYPVSLDVSYTDSEFGSILTPPIKQATGSNMSSPKTAAVSPASSRSTIPMDERQIDTEVEKARSKGKSPLKGMPDDERMEYEKDEMTLTPVKEIGPGLTMASPHVINKDDNFLMPGTVTDVVTSTEVDPALFNIDENKMDRAEPLRLDEQASVSMGTSGTSVSHTTGSSTGVPDAARSILSAFVQFGTEVVNNTCGIGVTPCSGTNNEKELLLETETHHSKRPVYLDEASILRFLRRITNNGFALLYLQPTDDSSNNPDDWKGRTVTMMINKGQSCNGAGSLDTTSQTPRLEWITVTGGRAVDATATTVNLLDIQSILTNDDEMDQDEDMCFFTITTANGDVHIFEAATLEERDRIVNGLKTLVARWTFHLIAGDPTATSELYSSHNYTVSSPDHDMPSLPNPSQTMDRVAHILLNA